MNLLFQKIITDSNSIPQFIDLGILEHCQALTQIQNILLAVSELATIRKVPYARIEEIATDILLFLNQIRMTTGDRLYIKVWSYLKSRLKVYEAFSNNEERYETSFNLFRLKECLQEIIKTKKV